MEDLAVRDPDAAVLAAFLEQMEFRTLARRTAEALGGAAPTPADLDRLCLDNIARFKRPKDYRFVAALPKNNYGKILKTELRQQMQDIDT